MNESCLPFELQQFKDTMCRKMKDACHNVYILKSVAMDGTVTDVKYGMNVVTNTGFSVMMTNSRTKNYHDLCIGTGTGTPAITDTALFTPFKDNTSYYSFNAVSNPITFDADTGIISTYKRSGYGYFDYNITGVTTPVNITEFGLGSMSWLLTHALVLDANGNTSYITKNPNERLYINVYTCCSINKALIETAWSNGIYLLGTPSEFADLNYYYYDGYLLNGTGATITMTGCDKTMETTSRCSIGAALSYLLEDRTKTIQWVGNGTFNSTSDRNQYFKRIKYTDPETLEINNAIETDSRTTGTIINQFATATYNESNRTGFIPATDFTITALTAFNVNSGAWDIPIQYTNSAKEYSTAFNKCLSFLTILNGTEITAYVYANTITDAITGFARASYVLYATDSYWDPSTWVLIEDNTAIPAALQHRRYFIRTTGGAVTLIPIYGVDHKVDPSREPITCSDTNVYASGDILGTNGSTWIRVNDYVIFPENETPTRFQLELPTGVTRGYPSTCSYSKDNTIADCVVENSIGKLCVYNVTSTGVTYEMVTPFESTGGVASSTMNVSFMHIDTGYAICQSLDTSSKKASIRPFDAAMAEIILPDVTFCHSIPYSTHCVYKDESNVTVAPTFKIFDIQTNTVIQTFTLPVGFQTIGLIGWSTFVYIRGTVDSTTKVYLYRTDNQTITLLDSDMVFRTDSFNWACTTIECNNLYMVCRDATISSATAYAVHVTDPAIVHSVLYTTRCGHLYDVSSIDSNGDDYTKSFYIGPYYTDARVVDLDLIVNGYAAPIIRPSYTIPTYWAIGCHNGIYYSAANTDSRLAPGIKWTPIEYVMNLRITGTTRSVQAYNNPVKVDVSTAFKVTNDPTAWSV